MMVTYMYGRCSVNGQTFSSDFNSTDRGSIVKDPDWKELEPDRVMLILLPVLSN